jgi:hypothetical protein
LVERILYRNFNRGKISSLKIAGYAGIAVLVCALAVLLFPDAFINKLLKGRITKAFAEAYPAYSIQIAGLHYRMFENRLECDSVALMKIDSTFSCSVARFSVSGIVQHLISQSSNEFSAVEIPNPTVLFQLC